MSKVTRLRARDGVKKNLGYEKLMICVWDVKVMKDTLAFLLLGQNPTKDSTRMRWEESHQKGRTTGSEVLKRTTLDLEVKVIRYRPREPVRPPRQEVRVHYERHILRLGFSDCDVLR